MLLEVKNTRYAADILRTSQPTISRALQKLREHFNDELFIRCPHGLEPTTRALEISEQLPSALEQLFASIEDHQQFNPQGFSEPITIALNGFIAQWLAVPLVKHLAALVPEAELKIISWENNTPDKIQHDDVHLGINYFLPELSKQFIQHKIGEDNFVMLCRQDHPVTKHDVFSADSFKTYSLASFIIPTWNDKQHYAETIMASYGIVTKTSLRSSYLQVLLDGLLQSDLVMPCSEHLARQLPDSFCYRPFSPEINVISGDFAAMTASKFRRRPINTWLIEQVRTVMATFSQNQ